MKEKTQEKGLVLINENSIFYKIKKFLKYIFHKNEAITNISIVEENTNISIEKEDTKNSFIDSIKNIENEETKLLKLQKQYRSGKIKEEDLSQEEVSKLCSLYDKQIADLRKSNQMRKQKLLEYRKKIQTEV